jgi:hypothetical protein
MEEKKIWNIRMPLKNNAKFRAKIFSKSNKNLQAFKKSLMKI